MKAPENPTPPASGTARRKYSTPVIRAYGTIRAITRNVANKAVTSDGGGMFSKTS